MHAGAGPREREPRAGGGASRTHSARAEAGGRAGSQGGYRQKGEGQAAQRVRSRSRSQDGGRYSFLFSFTPFYFHCSIFDIGRYPPSTIPPPTQPHPAPLSEKNPPISISE